MACPMGLPYCIMCLMGPEPCILQCSVAGPDRDSQRCLTHSEVFQILKLDNQICFTALRVTGRFWHAGRAMMHPEPSREMAGSPGPAHTMRAPQWQSSMCQVHGLPTQLHCASSVNVSLRRACGHSARGSLCWHSVRLCPCTGSHPSVAESLRSDALRCAATFMPAAAAVTMSYAQDLLDNLQLVLQ